MQDDTKVIGNYTFFWKTGSPFSQWHPSEFVPPDFLASERYGLSEDFRFKNAEQYMMYRKAVQFHDGDATSKILVCDNPRDVKSIGRGVRGFDASEWDAVKYDIVKTGNRLKFTQNPALLERLLATGTTKLVESSPTDRIWGIGLTMEDPRALDETKWLGENLLGKALTELRDELR